MGKWTDIQKGINLAFPVVPIDLRSGFRSEIQDENSIRMIILGFYSLILGLIVFLFAPKFLLAEFDLRQLTFLPIVHAVFLGWNLMVLTVVWLYYRGRFDIPRAIFTLVNLVTGILLICWSFFVSVIYQAGVMQDWFFIVSVFSVFALLLWSVTEMLIVLTVTMIVQVVLIEFVLALGGIGPGLFGLSFVIMAIAASLSRILYQARVKNFLHWENIGKMNLTLKREVSMHLKTMHELEEVRQQLDQKVAQQTRHLREANERLSEEVAERRYADKVRTILYRISTFVNGHNNLDEVFGYIHDQLSSIMEVRNFFVVSMKNHLTGFDYLYERYESKLSGARRTNQALCGLVLEKNKAILLNRRELQNYYQSGNLDMDGLSTKSSLGIPLRIEYRFVGVLSVQSLTDSVNYDRTDMELLEYVSEHVALAISRHESEMILIDAKEKAERSDQLKTTFLQNLSHEIRTPMNAIVGFSELYMDDDQDVGERNYYAGQVIKNSNYLLKLISDIIDLSKIQSGELAIKKSLLPVESMMNNLHSEFVITRKKMEKEHLHIEYQIDPQLIGANFYADAQSFRQIMHCLVENALKFTNEGGVIIGVQPFDPYRIQFFVRDTGIGIDQEDLPTIFDYFRQGTKASRQLYRGTGLGLALAKALVKEHYGHLWVESETGTGSCFFFTMSTSEKPGLVKMPQEVSAPRQNADDKHKVSAS